MKADPGARKAPVHLAYFLCYPSMVRGATGRSWSDLEGEALAARR